MKRTRKKSSNSLIDLGNVLLATSKVGLDLLQGFEWLFQTRQPTRREILQEQALYLKNALTEEKINHERIKQQVTANREIKTGLDIDAKTLQIRREEFKQITSGILPANQAQYYKRPSDKLG